jgi:short-subunit dehydrogenase
MDTWKMGNATLEGKVAIITGSSMGIGKEIAMALARKKVKIVLNGRKIDRLTATANEFKELKYDHLAIQGDVRKYEDCQKLIEKTIAEYGSIDILINNAGIAMEGSIEDTMPEVFENVFQTNILGVLLPTKAALTYLKKSKGSVVFIGSIAGLMGLPNYSAYSASKMALTALVQSLKIELTGSGVHVGLNYVGFVKNDKNKTFYNQDGELELMPVRDQFKKMSQEEVANLFVNGIEKRRYKQPFSLLGKLTIFTQRYFPGLFERLMIRNYNSQTEN